MITCKFEDGGDGKLRHAVAHGLVVRDGKILLVKRSEKIIEGAKWAFPGGFIGRDETAAQAVIRELKEETGWEGKVTLLFRINSNPNRPNDAGRQNIAFEFMIEPSEKTGEPDWEQSEVEWFDIDQFDDRAMAFDHGETIQLLRQYLKGEIPLPVTVV